MTDDKMALIELVEKQADGDLVREMLAFAAERLMEMEVEAVTCAVRISEEPDSVFAKSRTVISAIPGQFGGGWSLRCGHVS